jgi:hypothetical protein
MIHVLVVRNQLYKHLDIIIHNRNAKSVLILVGSLQPFVVDGPNYTSEMEEGQDAMNIEI